MSLFEWLFSRDIRIISQDSSYFHETPVLFHETIVISGDICIISRDNSYFTGHLSLQDRYIKTSRNRCFQMILNKQSGFRKNPRLQEAGKTRQQGLAIPLPNIFCRIPDSYFHETIVLFQKTVVISTRQLYYFTRQ